MLARAFPRPSAYTTSTRPNALVATTAFYLLATVSLSIRSYSTVFSVRFRVCTYLARFGTGSSSRPFVFVSPPHLKGSS